MPFGLRTWVGSKEPCIRWLPDPPLGRGNFEGKWRSIIKCKEGRVAVSYAKMAESLEMPFWYLDLASMY